MSLVCAQCSRVNPAEASYCYHDGAALAGRAGGPVNAGSALFPSPFVFPDGLACRNFDQLAVACQQHWQDAADLLKKGFLGTFLGNIGRLDLARAAQEAADYPDIDRGLDQLLAKLPTQAVQPPNLKAEPTEINLGQVTVGSDRATELHLTNLGMRLLYGTVATDCKWLTLGEAPGSTQKLFQFGADQVMPVHVVGKHLRAGNKPLEGRLVVESNGGTASVTVRADVPITPFKEGLFAGATTPRQVAEKAKANPKEAAPLFENGVVAEWYSSNGWNYPVQGPTMTGMGGIQQFFEALGVAKPPKLELATPQLQLEGERGQVLQAKIDVATPERKPAYAWATCDQPWVEFGTTKLNGRNASVPVTVTVPERAGAILEAKLQVIGNGNQKFVVPIKVNVLGAAPPPELEPEPVPAAAASTVADGGEFDFSTPAPPTAVADVEPIESDEPAVIAINRSGAAPRKAGEGKLPIAWPHLVPLGVLVLALLGAVVHDIFAPPKGGSSTASGDIDSRPRLDLQFDYIFSKADKDVRDESMMFGLAKLDPNLGKVKNPPRLTFGPRGHTNNVVVMIDGKERMFGKRGGGAGWVGRPQSIANGKSCTFEFPEKILVSQHVQLVAGEPVLIAPGEYKRRIDTCLVKYKIENKSKIKHTVGLRFLLDTYIGSEDGVPFTLPGEKVLVSAPKEFKTAKEVPDFLQVLENPDLKNPGLIMQLNFRISDKLQPPDRLTLTRHLYGTADAKEMERWKIGIPPPVKLGKTAKKAKIERKPFDGDSAVVMYWDPEDLEPGKSRDLGFTYGLGDIGEPALIGLTVGGSMYKGAVLTIVALVADPAAKEIKLELPEGLTLQEGEQTQPVAAVEAKKDGEAAPSPVTWRVRADSPGDFDIRVSASPGGATQTRKIKIEARPLF